MIHEGLWHELVAYIGLRRAVIQFQIKLLESREVCLAFVTMSGDHLLNIVNLLMSNIAMQIQVFGLSFCLYKFIFNHWFFNIHL